MVSTTVITLAGSLTARFGWSALRPPDAARLVGSAALVAFAQALVI